MLYFCENHIYKILIRLTINTILIFDRADSGQIYLKIEIVMALFN